MVMDDEIIKFLHGLVYYYDGFKNKYLEFQE